ncbi:hypothetical protein T492DRAFT_832450 [Pavlovales sp. CCMP2436]|nr:hypothetical protein T492DRAFT_832450 [Pavlovales sp. CCMP2436]
MHTQSLVTALAEAAAAKGRASAAEAALAMERDARIDEAEEAAGESSVQVEAMRLALREAADERRDWLRELDALHAKAYELAAEALKVAKTELAKLVGHQNPRQKIQLHVKIKEENNSLQIRCRELTDHTLRLERLLAGHSIAHGGGKKGVISSAAAVCARRRAIVGSTRGGFATAAAAGGGGSE